MTARWHGDAHSAMQLSAEKLLSLMDGTDALRRPERFHDFVDACAADHHGREGYIDVIYPPREYLLAALTAMQEIYFASIAKLHPDDVVDAIRRAKLERLQQFINERNTA
jgi:tRNA nucleotidyltransferase (CCA-adding enzyme)